MFRRVDFRFRQHDQTELNAEKDTLHAQLQTIHMSVLTAAMTVAAGEGTHSRQIMYIMGVLAGTMITPAVDGMHSKRLHPSHMLAAKRRLPKMIHLKCTMQLFTCFLHKYNYNVRRGKKTTSHFLEKYPNPTNLMSQLKKLRQLSQKLRG